MKRRKSRRKQWGGRGVGSNLVVWDTSRLQLVKSLHNVMNMRKGSNWATGLDHTLLLDERHLGSRGMGLCHAVPSAPPHMLLSRDSPSPSNMTLMQPSLQQSGALSLALVTPVL
jgi:hypothetical protein